MSEGAIVEDGPRWIARGAFTLETAQRIVDASASLPLPASGEIDLSGIDEADSSALAVLAALRRRALAEGRVLAFRAMPASLASLANVYGVEALFDA